MIQTALSLDVVNDLLGLLEIQPEWSSFAQTLDNLTPFQLPEWLITWWHYFGSGALRCFVFRDGSAISGVVPCFLHNWNGRRQLTLIGTGISDYLEPALKPEYANEIVSQIDSYLSSNPEWDLCGWQDLSFDTPFQRLTSQFASDTSCMKISLEGGFESYWESCPKALRQNVRRDRAKAEAQGEIRFDVTADPAPELVDGLIQMHRARWLRQNQPGMIEANGSAAFLRHIARKFAACQMLRIFSLRFNGNLAAVILAFDYRRQIFNYLTAFAPDYEHFGFGRTLLYEAIRYSFENGYRAWDFLRGDEPYKSWWRAQRVSKARLVLTRTA